MKLNRKLRARIDDLIALDIHDETSGARRTLTTIGAGGNENDLLDEVLYGDPSPMLQILDNLSRDDLDFVMALMIYGRGDGIAAAGKSFASVLEHAKLFEKAELACLVEEKPLGRYLARGLKRLKID